MFRLLRRRARSVESSICPQSWRATDRSLALENLEHRDVPSALTVTSLNDSGAGSFRQAIIDANANPGSTIHFNLGLSNFIQPLSALPAITSPVVIDGTTNPGSPIVVLSGTNAAGGAGLAINAAGCTVRGLDIIDWLGDGIDVNSNSNVIQGNVIGEFNGILPLGNANGIVVTGSDNTIGGTSMAAANVISGNRGDGIWIKDSGPAVTGNLVEGNFIGVISMGYFPMGNGGEGVTITGPAQANEIGGTAFGAGNVISANGGNGVSIITGANANFVVGNLIGTNAAGGSALSNGGDGIFVGSGAFGNAIGTSKAVQVSVTSSVGNLISGNAKNGVEIQGVGTNTNLLIDNRIGTNNGGTYAIPNKINGVLIHGGASNNQIGASSNNSGNVISGNAANGVDISDVGTTGNTLADNRIGTWCGGYAALANGANGVEIQSGASSNSVGVVGGGNLIAGNAGDGVLITLAGTSNNSVVANMIGTCANGYGTIGNRGDGIGITQNSSNNTIGGTAAGDGNVISGNGANGISINTGAAQNIVAGNMIGTNAAGTGAMGNKNDGVFVFSGANLNFIGKVPALGAPVGNVISGNGQSGVEISGAGATNNSLVANRIGTDRAGTYALPNRNGGVTIANGATANLIGSGAAGAGNLISGNWGDGILLTQNGTSNNVATANKIGTNAAGTSAVSNSQNGVVFNLGASNNSLVLNLISGNNIAGVLIDGIGTTGNQVSQNLIGTNSADTNALGNGGNGVAIDAGANANTIGGSAAINGNVISGNWGNGVALMSSATANLVENNLIGTNSGGTVALGNGGDGVLIESDAFANFIGNFQISKAGTLSEGNVISGNQQYGVEITGSGTHGNSLIDNRIGTNQAGTSALANMHSGVYLHNGANNNGIGTAVAGEGNLVSGNLGDGVFMTGLGTSNNFIEGDQIGTNLAGKAALPNGNTGVTIAWGASNNTIGGALAADGNVISGNKGAGVELNSANGNKVEQNQIGTESDKITPLPNLDGVVIEWGASNNFIGGVGVGNVIADNALAGISILGSNSVDNTVSQDAIFANNKLGIDLNYGGVTPNLPGGPHVGANNLQNFPVLGLGSSPGTIMGMLNGAHNATFKIEFFASATNALGQGKDLLGSTQVTTDAVGNAFFNFSFTPIVGEPFVTATATDSSGNTSEFSAAV